MYSRYSSQRTAPLPPRFATQRGCIYQDRRNVGYLEFDLSTISSSRSLATSCLGNLPYGAGWPTQCCRLHACTSLPFTIPFYVYTTYSTVAIQRLHHPPTSTCGRQ